MRAARLSAAVSAAVALALLAPLWLGRALPSHDNLFWAYPVFRWFALRWAEGSLATWNPLLHGGEPLWPALLQLRLLEPLTWLDVRLFALLADDPALWFNWDRLLQLFLNAALTLHLVRRWARGTLARALAAPLVLLSSYALHGFRSDGMFAQFLWAPALLDVMLGILEGGLSWPRAFLFAGLLGLKLQSYLFAAPLTFAGVFAAGAFLLERPRPDWRAAAPKLAAMFLLLALAALPNAALLLESRELVAVGRMLPATTLALGETPAYEGGPEELAPGPFLSYEAAALTGTLMTPRDFLEAADPSGAPREGRLYLGLLGLALAVCGAAFGRHPRKKLFGFMLGALALLALGPQVPGYELVFHLLPPLRLIRHSILFTPFVALCLLYFCCLGADALEDGAPRFSRPGLALAAAGAAWLALAGAADAPRAGGWQLLFWLAFGAAALRAAGRASPGAAGAGLLAAALAHVCPPHHALLFLVLPLAAAARLARGRRRAAAGALLVAALTADLGWAFHRARPLYTEPRPPEGARSWDCAAPAEAHAGAADGAGGRQALRYGPLLSGRAALLSPVYAEPGTRLSFAQALAAKRWDTFYMPRRAFELIHSGRPPAEIERELKPLCEEPRPARAFRWGVYGFVAAWVLAFGGAMAMMIVSRSKGSREKAKGKNPIRSE